MKSESKEKTISAFLSLDERGVPLISNRRPVSVVGGKWFVYAKGVHVWQLPNDEDGRNILDGCIGVLECKRIKITIKEV